MSIVEAIILGVVQGLTEPLPVSSSAHLVIVPALIPGFHQPSVAFDVLLHLGTLLAVVFFLRRDIGALLVSLMPGSTQNNHATGSGAGETAANRRMVLWILIATFLTGAIGVLFKDRIERLFESVEITACMLFITGILLFGSDRVKTNLRRKDDMNLQDAIVLGLVQTVALIPGISRSGSGAGDVGTIFLSAVHSGNRRRHHPEIGRPDAAHRRRSARTVRRFPNSRRDGLFVPEVSLRHHQQDRSRPLRLVLLVHRIRHADHSGNRMTRPKQICE